jgi:hypothetical protein
VADVEGRVAGEPFAERCDVGEPLAMEAVCQIAVLVVVDLVPEEDGLRVGSEDPRAVVG